MNDRSSWELISLKFWDDGNLIGQVIDLFFKIISLNFINLRATEGYLIINFMTKLVKVHTN